MDTHIIFAILLAALALVVVWRIVTLSVSFEGRFEGGTHLATEWEFTIRAGSLAMVRIRERGAPCSSTQIRLGNRCLVSRKAAEVPGDLPPSENADDGETGGLVKNIGRVLKIL